MDALLEISCFTIESCLIAQKAGAHRIEFCNDYERGGLTPSFDDILKVRDLIHIPLHVIIRFSTDPISKAHINEMQEAITFCRENGVDGVVFGSLTKANEVDIESCEILLEKVGAMKCTFHRDIDKCNNLEGNIEKLVRLGIDDVLTSGGKPTAMAGINRLASLQSEYGYQIQIIPGGGVRPANIAQLIQKTGCKIYHSSALPLNSKNADQSTIEELLQAINNS